MNVQQYFERINYRGPAAKTFEVLSELQLMHLRTVPFENLDICNHIKIDLDTLFDKIVARRRGGFCYELNGLFYQLLKELGFDVTTISARVYNGTTKGYSPEFDHMALIVSVNDVHYLVDEGLESLRCHQLIQNQVRKLLTYGAFLRWLYPMRIIK
jgi:N-hydroxyarylamine O-acetyltransferase